jgi:hypothetical protein
MEQARQPMRGRPRTVIDGWLLSKRSGLPASPPSSSVGADSWRVDVVSRFGEADRMRRDRRERPRRGGRERDNEPLRKTALYGTSCAAG